MTFTLNNPNGYRFVNPHWQKRTKNLRFVMQLAQSSTPLLFAYEDLKGKTWLRYYHLDGTCDDNTPLGGVDIEDKPVELRAVFINVYPDSIGGYIYSSKRAADLGAADEEHVVRLCTFKEGKIIDITEEVGI